MAHEAISVFDIFKIGVGPSSSHTLGPWRAAQRFIQSLKDKGLLQSITALEVLLYGSLAKTGRGHGTDVAIQLGLCGEDPVTFEVDRITPKMNDIAVMKRLVLGGLHEIPSIRWRILTFSFQSRFLTIRMRLAFGLFAKWGSGF